MQVIYYDFPQNLKNIRDIVMAFELDFKCNFKHTVIVNLCCFNEYSEEILKEMTSYNLKRKKNLFIFYGLLWKGYSGDDQERFLKEYDFYNLKCTWTSVPQRIASALRLANFVF